MASRATDRTVRFLRVGLRLSVVVAVLCGIADAYYRYSEALRASLPIQLKHISDSVSQLIEFDYRLQDCVGVNTTAPFCKKLQLFLNR